MKALVEFGWNKGEMDFGINGAVQDLSFEQMNKLRVMIIAGIGTMEDMWRREQERKCPASSALEGKP
jgi:hypothetical protein